MTGLLLEQTNGDAALDQHAVKQPREDVGRGGAGRELFRVCDRQPVGPSGSRRGEALDPLEPVIGSTEDGARVGVHEGPLEGEAAGVAVEPGHAEACSAASHRFAKCSGTFSRERCRPLPTVPPLPKPIPENGPTTTSMM